MRGPEAEAERGLGGGERQIIDLTTPLGLRTAFRFPLQSRVARWEVIQGGLWLLVPGVGWILNMGHRIAMTHRMQHGLPAWPAWVDYPALLRHGTITLLGMIEYHLPAVICGYLGWRWGMGWSWRRCCGWWQRWRCRGTCPTIAISWTRGRCLIRYGRCAG